MAWMDVVGGNRLRSTMPFSTPRSRGRRRGRTAIVLLLSGLVGWAGASGGGTTGGDDPGALDPARMALSADGTQLRLDGDLADGTARRLRRLLRASPGVTLVAFRSDGGLVDEAEQIGDIIAARGLATYVAESCVSACTLAFVRGRERAAAPTAQLGFHAPWEAGEGGREVQVPSDDERQAYVAAGIAADFVDQALSVPSSDIWFPDSERLLRAGVVHALVKPNDVEVRLARTPGSLAGLVPAP